MRMSKKSRRRPETRTVYVAVPASAYKRMKRATARAILAMVRATARCMYGPCRFLSPGLQKPCILWHRHVGGCLTAARTSWRRELSHGSAGFETLDGPRGPKKTEALMSEQTLREEIVKLDDGWHVMAKTGKHLGGPYDSKAKAVERLRQVDGHKDK